jgi:phosphotransferase system HPr (HPr) family protein
MLSQRKALIDPSASVAMSSDRQSRRVFVSNPSGLHLRGAAVISRFANEYPHSSFRITCGERQADAKSIFEIMCLRVGVGSELLLEATGPESVQALARMERLINRVLNFLPNEGSSQ